MAHDPAFQAALVNTAIYVAVVVPVTLVAGMIVALLIEAGRHFRAVHRAVHFLPVMATLAAKAIAWEALLHPTRPYGSDIDFRTGRCDLRPATGSGPKPCAIEDIIHRRVSARLTRRRLL